MSIVTVEVDVSVTVMESVIVVPGVVMTIGSRVVVVMEASIMVLVFVAVFLTCDCDSLLFRWELGLKTPASCRVVRVLVPKRLSVYGSGALYSRGACLSWKLHKGQRV